MSHGIYFSSIINLALPLIFVAKQKDTYIRHHLHIMTKKVIFWHSVIENFDSNPTYRQIFEIETEYDNAHTCFYIIGNKISATIENIIMLSSFCSINKTNNKNITIDFRISYIFTHISFYLTRKNTEMC